MYIYRERDKPGQAGALVVGNMKGKGHVTNKCILHVCATNEEGTHKSVRGNQKAHSLLV